MSNISREEWLTEATKIIGKEIMQKNETQLPEKWRVSVGFPVGSQTAIGQAWDKEACQDNETFNMFISPTLGEDKIQLLHVICHEILHCCVGIDQKHGGEFKRIARKIGFEGKLTATYASEGSDHYNDLQRILEVIEAEHGPYPHVPLIKKTKVRKEREKNIKFFSPTNPEYVVSVKEGILEAFGEPKDYEGNEMQPVEG
jgi:hypothetical protein